MLIARPCPRRRLAWVVVALAVLGASALIAFALTDPRSGAWDIVALLSSVERMEEAIASWGIWAPIASMLLMVAHSFLPFPAEMLAVANGMLFGLVVGAAITWAGAMVGALLAFGLARWMGQAFVRRRIGEERWRRVESWMTGQGVKALLLARLTPVISFNLVNYAAGLAGVGWWTFTWTTAVGILPITIASVLVGSHMAVIPWQLWIALVAGVAGLMVLHWRYRNVTSAAGTAKDSG
ncbi:MAG: TVP38/TMEM64 family protein [Rhizobiales bacterium]|nr:TVP38/TMEM64 family protein [Hyphomicrobiales bacterium]